MEVIDLNKIEPFPYTERDKNVFYQSEEFKARIIDLVPGEKIPHCKMNSYVIFVVIEGEARVTANGQKSIIGKGNCFISEPAVISLETEKGVRMIGLQISKKYGDTKKADRKA